MITRLRELRLENNYKIEDMSKMLNVCKAQYCLLEHGKRCLTYQKAYEISKIFNLKPDDLFYEYQKEKSEENLLKK